MPTLRTILVLALAGSLTSGTAPHAAPHCRIHLATPELISLRDGSVVYIEPASVSQAGGQTLVAGAPVYHWNASPNGVGDLLGRNEAFGAVLRTGRAAELIPQPIPGQFPAVVHAIGRGEGEWDVVFGDHTRPSPFSPVGDTIRALHSAFLRDGRWTQLEKIPLPDGYIALTGGASDLIRLADTLYWAIRAVAPDGRAKAVVLRRAPDAPGWSVTVLPTHRSTYLQLGRAGGTGLFLVEVGIDLDRRFDSNSIYWWEKAAEWRRTALIWDGASRGPAHHPTIRYAGETPVLNWWAEGTGDPRALVLRDPRATAAAPMILDDRYPILSPVLSAEVSGVHLAAIPTSGSPGAEPRLRMIAVGDSAELLEAPSNPFIAQYNLAPSGAGTFLMTGAASGQAVPVSTVVRGRLECGESSYSGDAARASQLRFVPLSSPAEYRLGSALPRIPAERRGWHGRRPRCLPRDRVGRQTAAPSGEPVGPAFTSWRLTSADGRSWPPLSRMRPAARPRNEAGAGWGRGARCCSRRKGRLGRALPLAVATQRLHAARTVCGQIELADSGRGSRLVHPNEALVRHVPVREDVEARSPRPRADRSADPSGKIAVRYGLPPRGFVQEEFPLLVDGDGERVRAHRLACRGLRQMGSADRRSDDHREHQKDKGQV